MKKQFKLKKCTKCGATVEVLKDCTCDNCGIKCCGQEMIELVSNTEDASFEKHVPTYEVVGKYVDNLCLCAQILFNISFSDFKACYCFH